MVGDSGSNEGGEGTEASVLAVPAQSEPGMDRIVEQVRALLRPPSEDEVAKLKAQFPNATLHLLTTEQDFNVVVVTPIPHQFYARFRRNSVGDNEKKAQAVEFLFRDVVVFPGPAAINQALKLKPALGETFGQKVIKLAGMEEEEDVQGKAL